MSQEKIPILLGWHINETNLKFQFTAFEGSFQVRYPRRGSFQGVLTWDIINGP